MEQENNLSFGLSLRRYENCLVYKLGQNVCRNLK